MGKRDIYQFRVALRDVRPEIWRRIQVPGSYSFWDLHVAIQDAMGWKDMHLHSFQLRDPVTKREVRFGIPDDEYPGNPPLRPGWEQPISRHFTAQSRSALYTYDFGDDWEHDVVLEEILPHPKGATLPRCLAGARACPPEDVGGFPGYEDFLVALRDPKHAEHASYLEWVGGRFDPEEFDPDPIRFDDPKERWRQAFESDADVEEDTSEPDSSPEIVRRGLREAIEKQMVAADPPETRAAFERLRAEGMPEEGIWPLLCAALATEIFQSLQHERPFDSEAYARKLRALPKLPFV